MASIDSARTHNIQSQPNTWANYLPEGVPPTREESGLVDDNLVLDDSQKEALEILASSRYATLIGAAGTGKTTLVKRAIANIIYGGDGIEAHGVRRLNNDELSVAIVAFTGKAVQVVKNMLPEFLHPSCQTIHSLLEYKPENELSKVFIPTRDHNHPLDHDIVIVDEASMVGLELWHNLVDALRPHTRVILVGDLNQLTPVADSPFFPAALDAARNGEDGWQLAKLTTVHRQTGPGANRLLDAAHAILNGKRPVFDLELNAKGQAVDSKGKRVETKPNPDWRIARIELNPRADHAHREIISWMDRFRKAQVKAGDDAGRFVYQPYDDLLLTAGNGETGYEAGAQVDQVALNESLSNIIVPEADENPKYIIDAGRKVRTYAVGDRVMATKNEQQGTKDRVTNGTIGVVTKITRNGLWRGDSTRFGSRKDVQNAWKNTVAVLHGEETLDSFDDFIKDMQEGNVDTDGMTDDGERYASHTVEIEYETGAKRTYATAAGVASTQLAYAITTHKAQGSQAPTVFIVCHSASSRMLNREWLYTAFTRAQKRVILFSTELGLRKAIAKQQVFGHDLDAKIDHYIRNIGRKGVYVRLIPSMARP